MNQNPQSNDVTLDASSTSVVIPNTFSAPDAQWVSRKQRATQFGDNKHGKHTRNWPTEEEKNKNLEVKEELLPESVQEFVDKHIIHILGENEQGQAFLKELKNKANSFTKEEIPDEPTPSA
jgi:hypothetical protein